MKNKKEMKSKKGTGTSLNPTSKSFKKGSTKSDAVTTQPSLPKGLKYKIKQISSHSLKFSTTLLSTLAMEFEFHLMVLNQIYSKQDMEHYYGDTIVKRPW